MNTELDELQWKSPEWIQTFGLRTDNVLDYFSESPFFDKTSNNHVIRMQQQFDGSPSPPPPSQGLNFNNGNGNGHLNDKSVPVSEYPVNRQYILQNYPVHHHLEREMKKLQRGIEYILWYVREPDYWIIRKQEKRGTQLSDYTTLSDYYIIGANVYMAPQLGKVIGSRMLSTNYHLSNALDKLNVITNGFTPSQGFGFVKVATASSSSSISLSSSSSSPAPLSTTEQQSQQHQHQHQHQQPLFSGPPTTTPGGLMNLGKTPSMTTFNTIDTNNMDTNNGGVPNGTAKEFLSNEIADKLLLASIKNDPVYL